VGDILFQWLHVGTPEASQMQRTAALQSKWDKLWVAAAAAAASAAVRHQAGAQTRDACYHQLQVYTDVHSVKLTLLLPAHLLPVTTATCDASGYVDTYVPAPA